MGKFNYVNGLKQSDITELVIRAEDPEKMLNQITADIQAELDKTIQRCENVRSSRIIAKENYQNAVKISRDYESKARDALIKGDRKLAEQLLIEKVKADEDAESYKEKYESVSDKAEMIRLDAETLKTKLKMINDQRASLIKLAKLNSISRKLGALHETDTSDDNAGDSEKSETVEKVLSELRRLVSEIDTPDNSGKQ